jgi:8-oxo-dGTP pyrophosphatase MutT (NUDIX family)
MNLLLREDTTGWPPEHIVFPVARIELRVLDGDHPYHVEHAAAVRENWEKELVANPAFYDGRMLFQRRLSVSTEAIVGESYVSPFSTFIYWRRQAERSGGFHVFAFGVIVSSDGAVIAIRMGQHTANAGQVYCPAGSMDENDIVGGYCDVEGNMRREVLEETGLDLRDGVADPGYFATQSDRSITLIRVYRFALTADEILARIREHMLIDEEKEIEGAVAIRSADPTAHHYSAAMPAILAWFFGETK